MIEGEEAHRLGFVSRLVPGPSLVDETVAFAAELAATTSPGSVATIKAQLRDHLDRNFDRAFAESEALMLDSFSGEDLKEGVAGYRERRPPRFASLPPR
jgi:enoyl-CoA hydratase/carnithine racemase